MSSYTSTQRFVKLTDYLLLEYQYTAVPNPEEYFVNSGAPSVGFEKIVNGHFDNTVQILNRPADVDITNNVRNLSVVQTENNRFVTLDTGLLVPYLNFDDELTDTANLPIIFPSNIGVYYDTIKFHIVSGYNFDNFDGIVLQVKFQERTGKKATVSQLVITKGDIDLPILNPNPIYLGGALYDHYIQTKIPSYHIMNNIYEQSLDPSETLASKISSDGNGFLKNSPIQFNLFEITQTSLKNGYQNYIGQLKSQLSIFPRDNFESLAGVIQENSYYNYLEYFPTWNGNFLEEFLTAEGKVGHSYYVVNEIEVKEQVGLTYITTYNFSSAQTNDFNAPVIFRPIIVNPLATSFVVNYTMRLVDKTDQNQIIRRSSFNSYDVNKYGRENNIITLTTGAYSQKVYNKLVQGSNILNSSGTGVSMDALKERRIPIFYKDNKISITKDNIIIDKTGNLITETSKTRSGDAEIYGQGEAMILIDPFDNYYRFTIYNIISGESLEVMDLGTSLSYFLVFLDESGQSARIENIKNRTSISNPANGQMAFKIAKNDSKKILKFNNRDFYIISITPEDDETKVYSGKWQKSSEYVASAPININTQAGLTSNTTISEVTTQTEINSASIIAGEQIVSGVPMSGKDNGTVYVNGSSSIMSIIPSSEANTTGAYSIPDPKIDASNRPKAGQANNIDITGLSDSIAGREALNMTPKRTVNYYFTPGAQGAILFKGITSSQFLSAAIKIHPKLPNGGYDPIYIQYCDALNRPVSDKL